MNFHELQVAQAGWAKKNFPSTSTGPLQYIGLTEEVGELGHCVIKDAQGIRGSHEEHMARMEDAVGDIVIYLAGVCTAYNIDMQTAVETAWAEVSNRDWTKYKLNGVNDTTRGG